MKNILFFSFSLPFFFFKLFGSISKELIGLDAELVASTSVQTESAKSRSVRALTSQRIGLFSISNE